MSGAESLSFGGQFRISLPRVGPASARRPAPGSRVASFLFAEESPAAPPAPAVGAPRRSERPGRRPPARAPAARLPESAGAYRLQGRSSPPVSERGGVLVVR